MVPVPARADCQRHKLRDRGNTDQTQFWIWYDWHDGIFWYRYSATPPKEGKTYGHVRTSWKKKKYTEFKSSWESNQTAEINQSWFSNGKQNSPINQKEENNFIVKP